MLGELGSCVLHDPRSTNFFSWDYRAGRLLVAAPDGGAMFILNPVREAGPVRPDALALHAMDLHERFTHRKGDGFFNLVVPPIRKPRFAGELAVIRYYADKGDQGGEAEWEHYFNEPEIAPAYPEIWALGHGQYLIPPGPWTITERGIEYAAETRTRDLVPSLDEFFTLH